MINISSYTLTKQIYESSYSLVYRGYRDRDKLPVILKMLKEGYPSPELMAWYQREYQITRSLNLPGVVDVYELVNLSDRPCIILEDFGGESLALLELAGKLKLEEFLNLAIKITEILSQIHGANIIHKDINPSNIILNPITGKVKIIDFGISTEFARETQTRSLSPLSLQFLEGTLAYISPEQTGRMNRDLDYRSDFYSLGITFYELLTGKLPFMSDDPLELIHCHLAQPPIFPESIIAEMPSDIIIKMMEKNAENRYQSAYGIKADLEKCLHQLKSKGRIESFLLASKDVNHRFIIPQKLYGREKEIKTLLTAFERVSYLLQPPLSKGGSNSAQGEVEIILVTGYSGVGKSTLVRELHKPITAKRGNFISGKFDQYQRNIPYLALTQAFNEFCNQLLTESEETLQEWQDKILAAVGKNGQILIDIIPNLELVIGKQTAVAKVGVTEAKNRFNLVFQSFIKTICLPEHPLVLFIDDLQWADSASLNLVKTIISEPEIKHLLIIGAYRDNEVNDTHALKLTLEEMQKEGVALGEIHLDNLNLQDVNTLIADALSCSHTYSQSLTDLVYAKTHGNAFFVTEFLQTIYLEGLLRFNLLQGSKDKWEWNVEEIKGKNITDNVVELMASKIAKFPENTSKVLQLAACIGNKFDLETLTIICQGKPQDVLTDLLPAIEETLVFPLNNKYKLLVAGDEVAKEVAFNFQHDRVQEAAYSLIGEEEKQEIHINIGRLLLKHSSNLEEKILDIVNHLNQGFSLINEESELKELAQLNLRAGKKAKAAKAYASGLNFLRFGQQLLSESSWENEYQLTLDLYIEAVEAEYLNANYEQAEILAEVVIKKAKSLLEKIKVYDTKVKIYLAQHRMSKAIDIGLEVLEKLGVSLANFLPENILPTQLYNLPEMSDRSKKSAIEILINVSHICYYVNPSLWYQLILTLVNLFITYGNSPYAAFAYTLYGMALCGSRKDIELGYEWGLLGLNLLNKIEEKEIKCKVITIFYANIMPWKKHIREGIKPLREIVPVALENGDIIHGIIAALYYLNNIFLVGNPLTTVEKEQRKYISLIEKLKQEEHFLYYAKLWTQVTVNLLGKAADKQQLKGDIFNETDSLPLLQQMNNFTLLYHFYERKIILCYLFEDYTAAINYGVEASKYEEGVGGLLCSASHTFYYSLALLTQTPTNMKQVATNQEKMKIWANHAPMNFQHKYDLIEAEKARVEGKNWEAALLYEKAIKGARENQYLQEEALAYELAARFYLTRGMEEIAATYLKSAHYCYSNWQAWAKVQHLEETYPQFFMDITKSNNSVKSNLTTNSKTANELDLTSIIKASQTLSAEIKLKSLLEKIMKLVLENAGAEKGYLLLEEDGKWSIIASATINSNQVEILQHLPLETAPIPQAIVNYVIRTQKSLVLDNAVKEGKFTRDFYIIQNQPKSVLCHPLLKRGKVAGILYLENRPLAKP